MRVPDCARTAIALAAIFPSALLAQSQWSCPDDGSTIVVTNAGSADKSYVFQQSALNIHDSSLEIRVVTRNAEGVITEVHQTIPWNYGTDPTVVVAPGRSIEIRDPQDDDKKPGQGTYREK
jgi:hypothetical protein